MANENDKKRTRPRASRGATRNPDLILFALPRVTLRRFLDGQNGENRVDSNGGRAASSDMAAWRRHAET